MSEVSDATGPEPSPEPEVAFGIYDLSVYYSGAVALRGVNLEIPAQAVTAMIGPSGCGKSTLLNCLNRMIDLKPNARLEGRVEYFGEDVYGKGVDPAEVRHRIGMVFQKPNPFPKSIYENVAFGPRIYGGRKLKGEALDTIVEAALTQAHLWNSVKNKLKTSAYNLSGGQQQRLCIARALAVDPEAILMDEPCSALDPLATQRIESVIQELGQTKTVVLVTHSLHQARIAEWTAFIDTIVEGEEENEHLHGELVEFDQTFKLFTNPRDPRTEEYLTLRHPEEHPET